MDSSACKKDVDFINSYKLILSSQWGIRPGRSIISQLLLAQSRLVNAFNERACNDAAYTDLS